jgi:4-hydroxy-tetrahydrodipicolinate synthase
MTMKSYALWTAVITPMMDNGSVDFESLTKVCKEQMEAKNGLLILGSTAEALNLNLSTRK